MILALAPGALLFCLALQKTSLTARVLSSRPLQFIGTISYSLYLIHPLVLFPLQMLGRMFAGHGAASQVYFVGYVISAIALSIVLAAISYELIEIRLRAAILKIMRGPHGGLRPRRALARAA